MKKEFPIKPEKNKKKKKNNATKAIMGQYPPKLINIPMYDPQTGEPNPHYEELTGYKNPLEILRKTGKSLEDEMLVTPNFEPVLRNRFLVKFPDSLGVKPFMVREITLPVVSMTRPRRLSVVHLLDSTPLLKISDLVIKLIDSATDPILHKINSIMRDYIKFTMSVETLDPMGVVISEIKLEDCFINRIDYGVFGYSLADNLYNYTISITPNSLKHY